MITTPEKTSYSALKKTVQNLVQEMVQKIVQKLVQKIVQGSNGPVQFITK